MKMKMFTGPAVDQVMAQIRAEMGPDAVILSTREEDGHVEIRAAVERSHNARFIAPVFKDAFRDQRPDQVRQMFDQTRSDLTASLRWHGAPDGFAHMVAEAGSRLGAGLEPIGSLAAGLETVLAFAPIQPAPEKSLFLVGPHGSGKTTAAAKLARQFSNRRESLEPVSADFDASGQTARLAALLLRPFVTAALSPDALFRLVRERDDAAQRLVIDGPPFNPLDEGDMQRLKSLISHMNVEPILVVSAETQPMDLEDTARAFGALGVRRVVLSRLDAVRRRGGAVAAISSARLSIAQLGLTPSVSGGLVPASAGRIARLLLADAPGTEAKGSAELLKGAA
jgi:flagellar biosynthesis protein FlhF